MSNFHSHHIPCPPMYGCTCGVQRILTQKIYSQCHFCECPEQGPVLSAEKCICMVVHPDIPVPDFGRVIRPGRPVRLPTWVTRIEFVCDSFRTQCIKVAAIRPAPCRCGFWDVLIKFVFEYEIRLYDEDGQPVSLICCSCPDGDYTDENATLKKTLRCTSHYMKQATMYGGSNPAPLIASDLLPQQSAPLLPTPHVLVEVHTKPAKLKLVRPLDTSEEWDLFDDNYQEPFNYVYASISLMYELTMFRYDTMDTDSFNSIF